MTHGCRLIAIVQWSGRHITGPLLRDPARCVTVTPDAAHPQRRSLSPGAPAPLPQQPVLTPTTSPRFPDIVEAPRPPAAAALEPLHEGDIIYLEVRRDHPASRAACGFLHADLLEFRLGMLPWDDEPRFAPANFRDCLFRVCPLLDFHDQASPVVPPTPGRCVWTLPPPCRALIAFRGLRVGCPRWDTAANPPFGGGGGGMATAYHFIPLTWS
jgi:hypothetical protein